MDKTAEQIEMDRIVREVTDGFRRDVAEIMSRHASQKPHGCICPPTSGKPARVNSARAGRSKSAFRSRAMQIEQIDRDAAARIYQNQRDHDMASWVAHGKADSDWIVRMFAAHRLAALSARPAVGEDVVERIVDAVIDAANIVSHDGYYEIDRDAATRAAIAAITGENHE